MGFFDWVGKKFKRTSVSSAQTLEARTLGIQELKNELAVSKQRDLDFSGKANELLDSVHKQVEELQQIVKKLEAARVDPDVPFAKIGEAMRNQLITIMPLLFKTLKKPEKLDYNTLIEYQENLSKFFENITKAVYGNRYVLHFFTDEMKSFAPTMHSLEDSAKQLKTVLDEKKKVVEAYAKLETQLNAVNYIPIEQAKLNKLLKENEIALRELTADKPEDANSIEQELEDANKAEKQIESMQSKMREQAAGFLNPLQRLMKKYAHGANEKQERMLAEKYASDPVKALFESTDSRECRALLSSLRKFTGETSEYSKHLNSINDFESSIQSTLEEYTLLNEQLKTAREKTNAVQEKKAKEQAKIAEKNRLLEEIEQNKAAVKQEMSKQSKLIAEIEEKASELLHARIIMKRTFD